MGLGAAQAQWEELCAVKRDEIERDTRLLADRKKNRCERLYRALEAAAAASPQIDAAFLQAVERCVTPADPMLVIYSSGSTADPKGAIHSHGAIVRHAFNLNSFRDLTGNTAVA